MIKWEKNHYKYGPPSDEGKLGKWKIFSISWRIMSKGDGEGERYALNCALPGFKDNLGYFATIEEAKERAEKALVVWLDGAGVK